MYLGAAPRGNVGRARLAPSRPPSLSLRLAPRPFGRQCRPAISINAEGALDGERAVDAGAAAAVAVAPQQAQRSGEVQPEQQQQQQPEQQQPDAAQSAEDAEAERRRLWKMAIKLPMYSVGVVPVLVGAAAAFGECGALAWGRCLGLLLGAVCVIAWLNLSNDAFDAATGVDETKPESVVNLTGSRGGVLLAAKAFLAAGLWLLFSSIQAAHDGHVVAMLGAAIACGYLYQGPPFRLSYKGLGEPLCFVAFGPLATTAFYLTLTTLQHPPPGAFPAAATAAGALLQWAASVPAAVWLSSLLVGATTSVILFCSHFHQIEGDAAAGKRSPLVRLGPARGAAVLRASVLGTYALAAAAAAAGALPLAAAAATVVSVPAARGLLDFCAANFSVPEKIAPLKRYAIKWHVAFGLALVAGLASGVFVL